MRLGDSKTCKLAWHPCWLNGFIGNTSHSKQLKSLPAETTSQTENDGLVFDFDVKPLPSFYVMNFSRILERNFLVGVIGVIRLRRFLLNLFLLELSNLSSDSALKFEEKLSRRRRTTELVGEGASRSG